MLESMNDPRRLRELTVAQLEALAAEIRQVIIDQVSRTGGHLAPNLGVVELSIALHRTFDFSFDRLLFDVGHQCYPHKLLTGRLNLFDRLRTREGMSGFPEPSESEYDLFRVGHAGTGISTAVGMAQGDQRTGEGFDPATRPDGRRSVALIGDASIVNGLAMEGLNAAGCLDRQLLVILNDNGMSISPPQGALARSFAAGKATAWFEAFGLKVVGPVDGHDLPSLLEALAEVAVSPQPTLLHVKTIKGKGLEAAEGDATTFHSPKPFTINGCRVEVSSGGRSFTAAFGDALADVMERDPRVVACSAAMPTGTGVQPVLERFPERTWDTGICESHALASMAGMAKAGLRPFFAVYSTFLQRAFDQAFQESALQGLPVRLCLDRAGVVGGDGAVHHGFCDVAILRTLPGAVLMAAIDEPSLREALEFMRQQDAGLSAVRYPRDSVDPRLTGEACPPYQLGRARLLTPEFADLDLARPDVAVLAYGPVAMTALDAAAELAGDLQVAVWDARFAKPVDQALVRSLLERRVPVVTVEDHTRVGGFGSAVLEAAQSMGLDAGAVIRAGLPDRWIRQNSRPAQLREAGLDRSGLERSIRAAAALRFEIPL